MLTEEKKAWLPERQELLLRLFNEQTNYREIADILTTTFGYLYTRSSVAGRIKRLGMSRRTNSLRHPRPPRRRPSQRKPIDWPIPPPGNVPIWELTSRHCKYLGSDRLYCGSPVIGTTSWCGYHYALTHHVKRAPSSSGASEAVPPHSSSPIGERTSSLNIIYGR